MGTQNQQLLNVTSVGPREDDPSRKSVVDVRKQHLIQRRGLGTKKKKKHRESGRPGDFPWHRGFVKGMTPDFGENGPRRSSGLCNDARLTANPAGHVWPGGLQASCLKPSSSLESSPTCAWCCHFKKLYSCVYKSRRNPRFYHVCMAKM